MMSDIFRIENYLQESYRETAKNREVLTGWSTLDDVSAREKMSPDMHLSTYSFDPENLALTSPMGDEFRTAHQKRVKRARQFSDDLFEVYYQAKTPLYANSKLAKAFPKAH